MHISGTAFDFCNLKFLFFHTAVRGHLLLKERLLVNTWKFLFSFKYVNRILVTVAKHNPQY